MLEIQEKFSTEGYEELVKKAGSAELHITEALDGGNVTGYIAYSYSSDKTVIYGLDDGNDLLLCDGQFSDEEAAHCVGFGHASWREAGALARACGAKRLLVIHHAPFRSDAALDAAAAELRTLCAEYDFAKEGERICL